MTGREKIEAAFSKDGTPQIPVVICYEDIYIRDHWKQLTSYPWWYRHEPDIERQLSWHKEVIEKIGQDWIILPSFYSREERQSISLEETNGKVFKLDKHAGSREELEEPTIGGWSRSGKGHSYKPEQLIDTNDGIDERVPEPDAANGNSQLLAGGEGELAARLLGDHARERYPIDHVVSPFSLTYDLWGFEGMMTMVARQPALVKYAARRFLDVSVRLVREAAALGAAAVWLEELYTDMISPDDHASLSLPFLKQLIEEIRGAGMKSIYYYTGDPKGKLELIISAGADAIAFEESKKGFVIDIEDVVAEVRGRCAVLGNLDAIGVLQDGSEEQVKAEITMQIAAGRKNNDRFIMSMGSPVTPGTPVERVRLYTDLARELGGG